MKIRESHRETCRRAWKRLGQPGTWWSATDRVALVRATREARQCTLCRQRKGALSPKFVSGNHETSTTLPSGAVEAVHRLITDPGRLTEKWYLEILASGLTPNQYVELVGVVALATVVDTFALAVGTIPPRLPTVSKGEPTHIEPPGALVQNAWVPTLSPDRLPPDLKELYGNLPSSLPPSLQSNEIVPEQRIGNVMLALSLVPEEQHAFTLLSSVELYRHANRLLTDDQREFVASITSNHNHCFY